MTLGYSTVVLAPVVIAVCSAKCDVIQSMVSIFQKVTGVPTTGVPMPFSQWLGLYESQFGRFAIRSYVDYVLYFAPTIELSVFETCDASAQQLGSNSRLLSVGLRTSS